MEWYGYAGFPVINKDYFALGTLCMLHKPPKALNQNQVELIEKITSNMALLLDVQVEQKEITSQKILEALVNFQKYDSNLTIQDFKSFVSIVSDIKIDKFQASFLVEKGLCKTNQNGSVELTTSGIKLQSDMKLEVKPMKKIKLAGDAAQSLIDEMYAKIN